RHRTAPAVGRPARRRDRGRTLVRRVPAPGTGRDRRRGDRAPMTCAPMTRVLVVDNHDSFVHTIVQYLRVLGATCDVRPRDEVRVSDADGYDGVLISPGPGTPEDAGVSVPLVHHAARHGLPLLGVC